MADGGIDLTTIILLGGMGVGAYVYRDEIMAIINGTGHQPCTKTCLPGSHLVSDICTCVSDTCTKTCTGNTHLNPSTCTCVPNTVCGGKTCGSGTHLNTSTCNCDPDGGAGGNITFCAAGDWGSGRNSNWQKTVATMKSQHPNAIIVPGDLSYAGGVGKWSPVTQAMHAFPEHPKVLVAQGNHDDGSYASASDAYSNSVTNVGNCSFMSLNSNSGSSAVSYCKANLSKMTGKWKIIFFHHPIYTVKSDHPADEKGMKGIIGPCEQAGVKMIISAHNHNYQRFAPVKGITYLVVGTGGEGAYSLGANCSGCPAIIKKTGSFGCLSVTTSNSSMSCKFVQNGGSVFDTFTI